MYVAIKLCQAVTCNQFLPSIGQSVLPLFLSRQRQEEFYRHPRRSMGMRGRVNPFEPLNPQPQRVPGIPAWTIPDGHIAQSKIGWYQTFTLTLNFGSSPFFKIDFAV